MMTGSTVSRDVVLGLVLVTLTACQAIAGRDSGFVRFEREVIDSELRDARAVLVADINGDGRKDIVALGHNPGALVWYSNPGWQRHNVETGSERLMDVVAQDITGNGFVDLALAGVFGDGDSARPEFSDAEPGSAESGKNRQINWLENPHTAPGVSAEALWTRHNVAQVPAPHQLRWADVSGRGVPVLLHLESAGNENAALTAYAVPRNPQSVWGSVALAGPLRSANELGVYDWNGDGRDQLLVADQSGITLYSLASGNRFVDSRMLIAAPEASAGMGELAVGYTGRSDRRFIATIEPEMGNEVAVYRPNPNGSGPWSREVLDASLTRGSALITADLNNDGYDEIIAGSRGQPNSLVIYRYDPTSRTWQRRVLDSRVTVSALAVADVTGNGFPDIVAVGASTTDVVLYRNSGR